MPFSVGFVDAVPTTSQPKYGRREMSRSVCLDAYIRVQTTTRYTTHAAEGLLFAPPEAAVKHYRKPTRGMSKNPSSLTMTKTPPLWSLDTCSPESRYVMTRYDEGSGCGASISGAVTALLTLWTVWRTGSRAARRGRRSRVCPRMLSSSGT